VAVLCIPILRWKQPQLARPIRVSMVWPVLYIIATVFITIVPMFEKPKETGTVLIREKNFEFGSV